MAPELRSQDAHKLEKQYKQMEQRYSDLQKLFVDAQTKHDLDMADIKTVLQTLCRRQEGSVFSYAAACFDNNSNNNVTRRCCGYLGGINKKLAVKGQSPSPTSFHSSAPKGMEFDEEGRNSRPGQIGGNSGPGNAFADRGGFRTGMGFNADEQGMNSLPGGSRSGSFGDRVGFQMGGNYNAPTDFSANRRDFEAGRMTRPMDFVKGIIDQDGWGAPRNIVATDADFVHIKLRRNNAFVCITDSKGNKKPQTYMSVGKLEKKLKGGKLSQYGAEATAEYVGQRARELGLKSFVVKVNGFTHFRKKRQVIVSFKEGFTQSRSGENPIVYIEDTTRKAHNGCRLPRKRRI
ncbi:hypothetical protein Tsubulata_005299 [Turnera subulata]|uniref:Ribosomal protein S11 n=1 Tax=Turnera subulata TaxID=218843 RepID=A0A9Q0J9V9_9ROSI|nr:hypothetical protein Tsubulata_005299 [Turnera subulata]